MSGTLIKAGAVTGHLPTKAYRGEFEGREANIMKRVGLWAVGIGVLASVGLLTVESGFAEGNDGAPKCTLATLKGRYLFGGGTATLFPPAFGITEQAIGSAAGFHIFNGNGHGHDYVTFTLNGIDQHVPSPNDLTYTLKADCTGTYAVVGGGPTFDIFVSPNGDEMTSINTDPGSAGSFTPSRRVWPK
jgi:hypothetical protein